MANFTDFCRPPDVDERMTRLVISPELSACFGSQFISPPSFPEAAAVDDDESKQVDRVRGQMLQQPDKKNGDRREKELRRKKSYWEKESHSREKGGNISNENSNIKQQEVTGYQTCNRETIIEGENSDPDNNHRDWCGMPEKLLVDILLRLPVVSLIRLKSVCKSWCAVIGGATFIAQHFDCNRGKDSLIAVNFSNDCYGGSVKICLLSGSKYEVCSDLEYLEWNGHGEVDIGNCCNGIVCMVNQNRGTAELWNPALKQKKRLPESWVSPSTLVLPMKYYWMCGFGYDAESNDYKVVKIHMRVGKGDTHKSIVEVYSLRGDSWKIIQDGLPVPNLVNHRMPWQTLTVNGKCYWIGRDNRYNEVVVSFDLNDERFETMALPSPSEEDLRCASYNVLDLLDGKLVCIKGTGDLCCNNSLWPTNYQIWVLQHDEDGETKCWSKLHDLGPTTYICGHERVPLAFSKDGRYLLLSDMVLGGGKTYVCDLGAGEDGGIETEETDLFLLSFDRYTESLVSLKGV